MTLSGWCGHEISGSSSLKLMSMHSSYSASSSGSISTYWSPRPCAVMNFFTCASAGKIEVVAPISAPILAIVALAGTSRAAAPGPTYSYTFPSPPLIVTSWSIFKMTSFGLHPGFREPVRFTFTTRGMVRRIGTPVIAVATSIPPTPIQSMPIAPPCGVWLSPPTLTFPGIPNLATWTAWQIPFPGLETWTPNRFAADCK